jgi:hypothetical protein
MRQPRPTRTIVARSLTSALLGVALLALLAGCALTQAQSTPTAAPIFSPIVQHSPVVSSGQLIEQTITQFCSAVHAGNYPQAYTYFSSGLKATVTSPSQISTIFGAQRKLTDCSEFGSGSFLRVNGTSATDQMLYTYLLVQLGSSSQGGGSMKFVQTGSAWQIDEITG